MPEWISHDTLDIIETDSTFSVPRNVLREYSVYLFFLAHQIRGSAVFTHMRKFYLTYPILTCGKDKKRTATGR